MSEEMNKETIYAMLREIKAVAVEASMTGALDKGSPMLIDVFNRCLASYKEIDPKVSALFEPIGAENGAPNIDEIGVAAALLSRYIKPERQNSDPLDPGGF